MATPTGRVAYPGDTLPSAAPGCEWRQEPNPSAGSCEASWYWVEYRL
jgi:hypothetical protein